MKKKLLVLLLATVIVLGVLGLNASADPEQATAVPVATALWAADNSVTVDGTATEANWLFDSQIKGSSGNTTFAKLWNGTDLYLAVKVGSAATLKTTLHGTTINVTLGSAPVADVSGVVVKQSGNMLEMKVPFSSIGFGMHGYSQQMDMTLELDSSRFEGKLTFVGQFVKTITGGEVSHGNFPTTSSVVKRYGYTQQQGSDYVNPDTGLSATNAPNNALATGQIGAVANTDGTYHFWNKYQTGKQNYMVAYSQVKVRNTTEISALTGAAVLDLDLKIADLPECNDPSQDYATFPKYMIAGFGVGIGRVNGSEELTVAIGNKTGVGLVLYVMTGDGAYESVTLNRQVSDETMHMSIRYGKNNTVAVWIDDVQVYYNASIALSSAVLGTNMVYLGLWNPSYKAGNTDAIIGSNYVPKSNAYDSDVYVSNVTLCTLNEGDLFDNLTFDAIKGENSDPSSVSGNLNLPAKLENAKFTTNLVWTSEPAGYISATGVVTPPEALTDVVLTATVAGTNPAISKSFNLTLAMPPVDAWKADSVTVDGDLSEYYNFARGYALTAEAGKPSGKVAARWTKDNLYIGAEYANAKVLALQIGGKILIADLVNKTLTDDQDAAISGANLAVGSSTAELSLPLSMFDLQITKDATTALSVIFADENNETGKSLLLGFYGISETADLPWVANSGVTVNGKLAEKAWQLYHHTSGRAGTPEGAIGQLWNGTDLYLAIDTAGAQSMKLVVAGNVIDIADLSAIPASRGVATAIAMDGDTVEMKIPFGEFYTLYNYGQTIDATLELTNASGTSGFAGQLVFTSKNLQYVSGAATNTIQNATNAWKGDVAEATANGQVGYTTVADENGNYTYRMWNKYVPGKTNHAIQRVRAKLGMATQMASMQGTIAVDFDLCVADMPAYTDPTSGWNSWRKYQPVGLGIGLGRFNSNEEELNLAITNMADGLVMFVGYGPFTNTCGADSIPYYGPFKLGKQVGDQFHVSLRYTEDGKIAAYVDDVLVMDFQDGGYTFTIPSVGVDFNLWSPYYEADNAKRPAGIEDILNPDSSPKNSDFDMDVTISNVKLGTVTCDNLLDTLTFEDIQGLNINPDLIMTDLNLPATLTDGRLSVPMTWSSSKEEAISNTGVVNTDNEGRVTLTAKLNDSLSKKFNLTVAASIVDTWKGSAYAEGRGYSFTAAGKPTGTLNARWDDSNLYLQIVDTNAAKVSVVLGEKSYSATVSGGKTEIKVPLKDLNLGTITNATATPMYISLTGDTGTATKKVQLSFFGAPEVTNVGFEDSITVDGTTDEGAWRFYHDSFGRITAPTGKMAALWGNDSLYLAVNAEGISKLTLTLNGKKATVDLATMAVSGMENVTVAKSEKAIELQIPFVSFDFKLTNYGQTAPMLMELEGKGGVCGFAADLTFTALEHVTNTAAGSFAGYIAVPNRWGPESNIEAAMATGQIGSTTRLDNNGNYIYRFWNKYQEGKTNYGVQRLRFTDLGLKNTITTLDGILSLDMDLNILDMPAYADPTSGDIIHRTYQPAGFGIGLGRYNEAEEELNLAISNTANGLALYVGYGPFTSEYGKDTVPYYGPYYIDRELGEQFHLTFHYTEDGQVSAYVDDVLVMDFVDGGYAYATSNTGLQFNIWSPSYDASTAHLVGELGVPVSSEFNTDVQISSVKLSTVSCYDLRDLITFDTIKGQNGSPDLIAKNLTLPTTVSDSNKLSSTVVWSSSDTKAITNTGVVTTQDKDVKVKLTAKVGQFTKDFDLCVVLPTVDAWRTTSANVNGTLAEYFDFARGYTFPDGSAIAARWTKNTLYLAGKTTGNTMVVTLGGKTITANLSKKTVSGISGASIAVGNGTVELGIPMSQLGFSNITQGTAKPMSVTLGGVKKQLSLTFFGVYETSHASWNDGTIAIDGILDEDWLMYTETTGRVGSPDGVIGKMWNGSDLFIAVDTDGASTLYVTLNGKPEAIDLANPVASGLITEIAKQNNIVEMKLSFKDFFTLVNYGQVIDVKVELENEVGVSGFDGGFEFTSREHLAAMNKSSQSVNNSAVQMFGTSEDAEAAQKSGQVGCTDTADEYGRHTYHMWNKYLAGQKNYAVQRVMSYATVPDVFLEQTGTVTLDFDVRIDDMPVYEDPTSGDIIFRKYQAAGLGVLLGRGIDGEELNLVISNTKDGLALFVGYGPFTSDYGSGTIPYDGPHKINKALGEEFHVMLHFSEKGELAVYIDDVLIYEPTEVGQDFSAIGANRCNFSLWSGSNAAGLLNDFLDANSAPKNDRANTDVTISDVRFGASSGTNILDLVTYETIQGNNGDANSVVSNLNLPTSISDGKISAKLSWTSSNRGAITNGGTVYPQDERTPVDLTVSLIGAKPAITKTFPLTVVMPFVDTWQTNFVKVDGDLSEYYGLTRGYTFASASGKPSGSIAAGWSKDRSRLYYAIKYNNTTKITITMGSRVIVVDLEKQSISGVKNAQLKVGEKNTVEIAIPLDQVRITEVKNNMLYDIGVKLENTKTSVSKNLTLAFYGQPAVGLASWDNKTVVLDGKIDEEAWLLYSLIEGRPGTPEGSFGRLWNGTDLYMAVNTAGAKKMTLLLGEKTMTVDLTKATPSVSGMNNVKIAKDGDFIELKIPMKSFGFTLHNYTESVNMKLELSNNVGTSGFYGVLQFASREALFNGETGNLAITNVNTNNFGDEENITKAKESGQVGYIVEPTATGGYSYHMWNIYQEGKQNYPVQRISAGGVSTEQRTIMDGINGIMTVDFNVRIDDMPEYKDVEIPDTFFRKYQPAGLGIFIGRNLPGEEISFVITNEMGGLAMYMGSGPLDDSYGSGTVQWTGPFYIGKELGQQFHVSVHQTMKGEVQVYIDDEILYQFRDVGADFALGSSGVTFSLWSQYYVEKYNAGFLNKDSSPKNADASSDVTVSDVQIGTATCYDLMDYLDFDYIKANNGAYDNVISDLSLPASLTDGKLKSSLSWESSKPHVVSEKGKVSTQDKDTTVILKASLNGTDPLQYKELEVSVALPPVDSWYNASVSLDGKADEYHSFKRGYDFVKVSGKPTGSVGAAWDNDTMYIGIKYQGADELKIKIEGKTLKADLAKGTVSGIDGAKIAMGDGIAEIAIPKSILKERSVKEEQVDMVVTLIKGENETEKGLRMSFYGRTMDGVVGFGGTDMKVDGSISEIAYQLYSQPDGRMGTPEGRIGKVWSGKDLYLAMFVDSAKTVTVTLNGKSATINTATLSKTGNLISSIAKGTYSYVDLEGEIIRGTLLEMKIPFSAFGFEMYTYGLTADMTVEMENAVGVSAYSTKMAFTNKVSKNYITELPESPTPTNAQSGNSEAATRGMKAGIIGAQMTSLNEGRFDYRMWNVYDPSVNGWSEMLTSQVSKSNDIYEPMAVLEGDFYFEFDVRIDKMCTQKEKVAAKITSYGNLGLCFWLSRGIPGQEFVGGICETEQDGLVFALRHPETTIQMKCPIPRERGEMFHVTIQWKDNGDLIIYIDDELLWEVPGGVCAPRSESSPANRGLMRMMILSPATWSKLDSDTQSVDFTVSNIMAGYAEEADLLQLLDFNDFKGENRRIDEVHKDIPLPKTVTDGVLNADLIWESSNLSVISIVNGVAKVTPQDEDAKVTLTARMANNKDIFRTFEVTVTCPIVDAQLIGTAKTGSYKLPDGSTLSARWDKDNIYLDITGKTSADLTFGDKKITVANGAVTGIEGGKAAVSGNKVTITLPRSALGITIPEYHTTQRFTIGGKVLKLEFVGYDSIADEYLASQALRDFVAGLKKVTSDLTLPQTYTSQFVDGKLTMAWSSDTLRVVDNNGKVTRPSKVDALVRLSLLVDDKSIATFDANVIAESKPDLASTTDLRVPYGKGIKIDGSISEQGWSMNSNLATGDKVIGKMGVQWDTEYLYMAFQYGSAKSLTITLEGKTANINLSSVSVSGDLKIAQIKKGSYLELKIAMKDLGLANIIDYGEKITAKVMLDSTSFEGIFTLTSIQWFATDNPEHRYIPRVDSEVDIAESTENEDGESEAVEFTNNWKTTTNGYYYFDDYIYGGQNKAALTTSNSFVNSSKKGTEVFAPMELSGQVGLYTEFDFQALSMPIYTGGVKNENKAGSHTFMATTGFSWQIGGYANKVEGTSEWLSMGMYMSESGLVIMVRVGKNDFYSFPTGKQNGDLFRIGVAWTKDDTLILFVDGEKMGEVENAVTYGTTMSNGGMGFRITRNKNAAACDSDSFRINVTNIAMGYYYGECMLDNIDWNEIKNDNINYASVTMDLDLMKEFATPQLSSGKLSWASSDPSISSDGTVLRPEGKSYTLAELTVTNELGHSKQILTAVKGHKELDDILYIKDDYDVVHGAGQPYIGGAFAIIDQENTSIVKDLKESKKISVVKITDLDTENRLYEDFLTVWVSDDNATYTEVKEFSFYQNGKDTYLYGFEAEGRYIKVHCTHNDAEEAMGEVFFPEVIDAYYEEIFGDGGSSFGTKKTVTVKNNESEDMMDMPWSFTASQLGIVSLADNMADIRIFCGEKLLYHYVEDGMVFVRIPEIKAGGKTKLTILSGNKDAMDISNKEFVYEVIYGTRELFNAAGSGTGLDPYYRTRCMYTLPDGTIVTTVRADSSYDDNRVDCRIWMYSADNGRTWKYMGVAEEFLVGAAPGGFVYDQHTNILYSYGYGNPTNATNYLETNMVKLDLNNGIENAKWEFAAKLTEGLDYAINYSHGITLKDYDGDGPNVDMIIPLVSSYEGESKLEKYVRISYTRDGGKTWQYEKENGIYDPTLQVGYEMGCSEPTLLELEDRTIVIIMRYQSKETVSFGYAYSKDHGITWTDVIPSYINSVNTQPMFLETDTGFTALAWAGNNIQGGTSYQRYPQNLAIPVVEDDRSNIKATAIQNTFLRGYFNNLKEDNHRNTNLYLTYTLDGAILIDSPLGSGGHKLTRVDDYEDYITKSKGSYDSFEKGSTKYEGWADITGTTLTIDKMATSGSYSMQLFGQSVRSVPYFRYGTVSFDLSWTAGTEFKLELETTYHPDFMKGSPSAFIIDRNGNVLDHNRVDTGIDVVEGWNKLVMDVDLPNGKVSVSVNGSESAALAISEDFSEYVCYIAMHADNYVYVDNFTQIGESADINPLAKESNKAAFDLTAILLIGVPVLIVAAAAVLFLRKKKAK